MTNDPRVTRGRRTRRPRYADGDVTVVRVHRTVWREAMRLAGGDRSRITVLSPTKVEVRTD